MRIEQTIEIGRSPEQVWAFVADPTNDPQWCPKVKSVEEVGPRRWNIRHKPVPLRPPVALEVAHLSREEPSRLTMREEDDASVFDVEYRLESTAGGTRFTQISDFEWKRLPRLLRWTFDRGVRRDVRRQLRELKRVLESSPRPGAQAHARGVPPSV